MKQFSLKNIIISGVALIGAIATFLPWATVSFLGVSMSTNGIAEGAIDGWFTLLAFVAIIVVACVSRKKICTSVQRLVSL